MERPILNKAATSFQELFGISDERKDELIAETYLEVRPGYSVLSKIVARFLNRAKTTNEQLYMMFHSMMILNHMRNTTDIDIFKVFTDDDPDSEEEHKIG